MCTIPDNDTMEDMTMNPTPAELELEEVDCPNCGRLHIPDEYEGQFHDVCVECLDNPGDA